MSRHLKTRKHLLPFLSVVSLVAIVLSVVLYRHLQTQQRATAQMMALWTDGAGNPELGVGKAVTTNAVQQVLTHGADVNSTDQDGYPVLILASVADNVGVVRFLLDHGAKVDARHIPPRQFSLAEVTWLLHGKIGPDPDDPGNLFDETALMEAAEGNDLQVAQLLLAHGADVNAKTDEGDTALMLAQGHPDMVTLLKAAGAK